MQIANRQSERPLICNLQGFIPEGLVADHEFRVEHLGSLFAKLHAHDVTDICLCGAIQKPVLEWRRFDLKTLRLLPKIFRALFFRREDGALRIAIALFEQAGFRVRAAHDLAPNLLPESGVLTQETASNIDAELALARDALKQMGARDIGQSVLVGQGRVLATEDETGTDALLARFANSPEAKGGVLYKAPKPNQDRRADLPTVGLETGRGAIEIGLSGIVIEAGGVMVLDRDELVRRLDAAGLFLWVRAS